ncbi:MAG TPA: DeoR/GlpR transcriptional regulator [Firmicutes bacterium]|jgi:DeoR/GlpR family transcriptional regulator of sugar metabolism|nr:DeoR/GlpR transcriptional regulator [Bacillota bacterium]
MREVRLTQILQQLGDNGFVKVSELSEILGVSKVTIRADLEYLEQMKKCRRTRGGATLPAGVNEPPTPYSLRETLLTAEKRAIGKKAAQLVEDRDIIILDASTTVSAMAIALRNREDLNRLTVITNGLGVMNELIRCRHIQLICLGGTGLPESNCFVGPIAEQQLAGLRANKAFISPHGLTLERGLGDWSLYEASIRRTMIKAAEKLYILADHSKFDIPSPFTIAPVHPLTGFVTNEPVASKWLVSDSCTPEVLVAASKS